MKLIKKIKLEDLLLVFIILQPFLDMYRQIIGEKWDVLGFSIVTIIRMLFITSLTVITIVKMVKKKEKRVKSNKLTLLLKWSGLYICRLEKMLFFLKHN